MSCNSKTISLFYYISSLEEVDIGFEVINHCISEFKFNDIVVLFKVNDIDFSKFKKIGCRIVKDDLDSSYESYNFFMVNRLADHIKTDYVLTVQNDGFIINPSAWSDNNYNYDYIGAPWYNPVGKDDLRVGNGGFSLRSKKLIEACKEISKHLDSKLIGNEDMFICQYSKEVLENTYGIKFAPVKLAAKFSVEWHTCPEQNHIIPDDFETFDTFGFHGRFYKELMHSKFLKK
jgi:hypothetical protein